MICAQWLTGVLIDCAGLQILIPLSEAIRDSGAPCELTIKLNFTWNLVLREFLFFFFSWLVYYYYFTILYWFCHTSTWIRHRCTCVPNPEPPSHVPPHTIPLGHPSVPAPSFLYPASNLDWWFVSYMILYMFQCHSPKSSPLPLPQSPKDCSIHLCLFSQLPYNLTVSPKNTRSINSKQFLF